MKNRLLFIVTISVLLAIILWICGLMPLLHKFNIKLLDALISLF